MDVHFECTQCGNCCRDLKLPLTVVEAINWLTDGYSVQIICEALPWLKEPPADDRKAAHRWQRSFAATSGSMPSRVVVILAANFAGSCPNLMADMRCGIYERRPLVCRVYPAEINPFLQLDVARKACPPEAWGVEHPLLLRDGRVVDARVRESIRQSRDTDRRNVEIKRRLCMALNLNSTALADEGFVVHSPDRAGLLTQLARAVEKPDVETVDTQWRFISNRAETVDSLAVQGALVSIARANDKSPYEYLGFHPPSIGAANPRL
jgi:Fe-S-cluster containining protein